MPSLSPVRLLRVRQRFDPARVDDVAAAVRDTLTRLPLSSTVGRGQTVAIGVGSRGIASLDTIVRSVVESVRAVGGVPFIVPAMGSHGGGTPEGQRAVLETYGVTEAAVGAPVRASMETVVLGTTADGLPIHFDRLAHEADCVVVVNRIKPHTTFSGPIESGLAKMLCIGLGKHLGASVCHRALVTTPWERLMTTACEAVLARVRFAFGLAIVENGYDQTAHLEAVPAATLLAREPALLRMAVDWMPRLPVAQADLLIVDEMGKHISGLGMDTNVTGRKPGAGARGGPMIQQLFVRDLAPQSHGNAHGIGLADFTTARLVRAMDYQATTLNAITAAHPEAAVLPMQFETDHEALVAALATTPLGPAAASRILRIRSTRHLAEVDVSEPCIAELSGRADVEVVGEPRPLAFDAAGNLLPFDAA